MENSPVLIHTYGGDLPIETKEVLRYMGCKDNVPDEICALATRAVQELKNNIHPNACYKIIPKFYSRGDMVDLGFVKIQSQGLVRCLGQSKRVCIFAATLGIEADRLVMRYTKTEPSYALALQAAGAAAIESYCDFLCREVFDTCARRFSAGYGDVSLAHQKEIFSFLDCARRIGLALTESCMMTPSKSVTAFVGIERSCSSVSNACNTCKKTDCEFRRG